MSCAKDLPDDHYHQPVRRLPPTRPLPDPGSPRWFAVHLVPGRCFCCGRSGNLAIKRVEVIRKIYTVGCNCGAAGPQAYSAKDAYTGWRKICRKVDLVRRFKGYMELKERCRKAEKGSKCKPTS